MKAFLFFFFLLQADCFPISDNNTQLHINQTTPPHKSDQTHISQWTEKITMKITTMVTRMSTFKLAFHGKTTTLTYKGKK